MKTLVVINGKLTDSVIKAVRGWLQSDDWKHVVHSEPLENHRPFELVLFVGCNCLEKLAETSGARVVELPHPDYLSWTKKSLDFAGRMIREGDESESLEMRIDKRMNRLIVECLIPF